MSDKSFIDLCLEGKVLAQDIDEYVSKWNKSSSDLSIELIDYLGMTQTEYNAWMLDDDVLPYIIKAHKDHIDFSEAYLDEDIKIAARGSTTEDVKKLLNWLKNNE